MTPEELLRPRYKLIVDYPGNSRPIGCVFVMDRKDSEGRYTTTGYLRESFFTTLYPHLFKKLEWWEERKPEDLPKFIKSKNDGNVQELIAVTECGFKVKWGNKKKYRIGVFNRFIPATEAEYTQYVKTLNQQQ